MKSKIILTESQEMAVEKINDFMKRSITGDLSSRVFRLTGRAGSGKTTVIKHCLKDYIKRDENNDFDMMFGGIGTPSVMGVTPSHKAKNVLRESLPNVRTFASAYGLKKTENNDGTVEFKKDRKKGMNFEKLPCELPCDVFVFDECSMIGKKMLEFIMKDTNSRSKIIFMGDAGQLPPVEDPKDALYLHPDIDSPVFDLQLDKGSTHELKEIVRQTEGNPIVHISSLIYDQIFGANDYKSIMNLISLPIFNEESGVGFNVIKSSELIDAYKEEKDYMKSKIIAYRVKTVDTHNFNVRQAIYNNPKQPYIPGEIIYMNNTFIKGRKTVSQSGYTLYNSDEFFIEDVIEDKEANYDCLKLMVNTSNHDYLRNLNSVYIPIPYGKGLKEYNKQLKLLKEQALDPLEREKGRLWRQFYKLKETFGDISYGYTFTGHKAQGSTYDSVYVDVNDIFTVGPITAKRKLQALYTAITRARKKVSFIKKG